MIFREFPKTILITPFDEDGYEKDQVEITVMFVTKKFRKLPDGDEAELIVAVGYDSDKNIHETILNQGKIIEVENYGSKTRSSRSTGREVRKRGTKAADRDNNSPDAETVETEK